LATTRISLARMLLNMVLESTRTTLRLASSSYLRQQLLRTSRLLSTAIKASLSMSRQQASLMSPSSSKNHMNSTCQMLFLALLVKDTSM
jgi:hypothetical protein